MKCSKCGTEIKQNAKFCENCGAQVEVKKNANNKILITVLKIVGIFIIILLLALITKEVIRGISNRQDAKNNQSETTKVEEDKNEYYITLSNSKANLESKEESDNYNVGDMYNDSKIIGIYKTSSDYSSISKDNKDIAGNSIIIEEEINKKEKIVVYNYKTNTKYTTKISPTDFSLGKLEKVVLNDNVIGLIVNPISTSDSKTAYYSLEKKKPVVTFSNEYEDANELIAYESYTKKGYLIRVNKKKNIKKNENAENSYNEEKTAIYSLIDIKTGKEVEKSILKDGEYYTINSAGVTLAYTNKKYNYLDEEFNGVFAKDYDSSTNFYEYNDKVYAYTYDKGYEVYDTKTKKLTQNDMAGVEIQDCYLKYFVTYKNNEVLIYSADTANIIEKINFVSPENRPPVWPISFRQIENDDKLADGVYLFVGYPGECSVYKINESNDSVELMDSALDYCNR